MRKVRKMLLLMSCVALFAGTASAIHAQESTIESKEFKQLKEIQAIAHTIRPQKSEDAFDTIPWQTSLWDARVKAAKEGKPILLWEMDGHPLGCG